MKKMLITLVTLTLLGWSTLALANPYSTPSAPATSTGTFTVTYAAYSGGDLYTFLEERDESGTWIEIDDPNVTGSVQLARSPGTYEYRVHVIEIDADEYGAFVDHDYSLSAQVVVIDFDIPDLDVIEDQLAYDYVVKAGHIDSDGLLDFFVQRVSGDLDNGVVAEALLRQQSDGNFSNFYPTPSQLATAMSWPIADLTISLGDFNLDEIVDVVVSKVPEGTVPQILLSSGEYFGRNPSAIFALDDDLQLFYADVSGWLGDADYFANAVTPDLPGYNIRVDYVVEFCYSFFGLPLCFSENFKVLDFDISLEDLGLDGYLGEIGGGVNEPGGGTQGAMNKASPGGVTAYAAGTYISSDVHNMGSPFLAEYNIPTLIGTAAEQDFAMEKLASNLPSSSDPQVLRCVIFCGFSFGFGFDGSYTIVSWVDTWTPITMPGEFDETNFSADAFEMSQYLEDLFIGGETAVSLDSWLQIGEILSRAQGVPVPVPTDPGTFPGPEVDPANDPDANPKKRKRFWLFGRFAIGLAAIELADELNARIRQNKLIYHVTDAAGAAAIADTGQIIKPSEPVGGDVFFAGLVYPTDKLARERLALCGPLRVGMYAVRLVTAGVHQVKEVDPKLCDDGSNPQGGGTEFIASSPVNALPLRFIPMLPDFPEDFVFE